jgi:hypothetical protein
MIRFQNFYENVLFSVWGNRRGSGRDDGARANEFNVKKKSEPKIQKRKYIFVVNTYSEPPFFPHMGNALMTSRKICTPSFLIKEHSLMTSLEVWSLMSHKAFVLKWRHSFYDLHFVTIFKHSTNILSPQNPRTPPFKPVSSLLDNP